MGIMVYSLLWVMQDFVHQPYFYTIALVKVVAIIIMAIIIAIAIVKLVILIVRRIIVTTVFYQEFRV